MTLDYASKKMEGLSFRWNPQTFPHLQVLDQQLLPGVEKWISISNVSEMISVIKHLKVRGAPLIGVTAVLALAQSAMQGTSQKKLIQESHELMEARPTAVNLMNCIRRLLVVIELPEYKIANVVEQALAMTEEDISLCEKMSAHGADLIQDGDSILTHCNTGGLATAGIGTALGVIRKAHEQGKKIHVYVDETRPLLQGGRLTAWELTQLKIPFTLITDNMAAQVMSLGKINKIFVGCDRIAANGDFANKIGTYGVAVSAHFHRIPFYVVGPQTTVDPSCPSGADIPIEERSAQEVRGALGSFGNIEWAPAQCHVYNPSFDVTPAGLVSGWVLDSGIYDYKDIQRGVFK